MYFDHTRLFIQLLDPLTFPTHSILCLYWFFFNQSSIICTALTLCSTWPSTGAWLIYPGHTLQKTLSFSHQLSTTNISLAWDGSSTPLCCFVLLCYQHPAFPAPFWKASNCASNCLNVFANKTPWVYSSAVSGSLFCSTDLGVYFIRLWFTVHDEDYRILVFLR